MKTKSCTICAGKLVYGDPAKECFRCDRTGQVSADWEEPKDPPMELIRKTAFDVGYAVAVHGSQMRDFDIIAVPWTPEAGGCRRVVDALCKALNATIVDRASKPHGRYSFALQIDGAFKLIDLSVTPTLRDVPSFPHFFKRDKRDTD